MPGVPYPLTGETMGELKSQMYEVLRQLYEEKIGGADLGDVFAIVGDVLTLVIDPDVSGLQKTGNKLAIKLPTASGLIATTDGLYIKNVTTGGIEITGSGISVKLDGTTLVVSGSGLKVCATLENLSTPDTGWAVTNVTEDKDFDADATSTAELADVLGTLITLLINKGVLSA